MKHAMGYRYREEGRALRDLDRFLSTRLSAADPLVTPAVVHEYVARRGTESETTRAHRLTLIREVCRFLRLDDARVVVPDRRSLRIVRQKFVPRVLSRDEGNRFLQACAELPPGQASPIRAAVLGTALAPSLSGWVASWRTAAAYAGRSRSRRWHAAHPAQQIRQIAAGPARTGFDPAPCSVAASRQPSTSGPVAPETPLFPSPRGGRYSITALRGAFHHALKTAGIERTTDIRIRLHDLRHSFAVFGFCCGVNRMSTSARSCHFWPRTLDM